MKIEFGFRKIIHQVENVFLLVIALFTVIGVGKEIYLIAVKRDVGLQDLLLMFLYVEVLAMVGAYYESKQVPITRKRCSNRIFRAFSSEGMMRAHELRSFQP